MVQPATGQVILIPFPFSDLSQSKLRPAVCLADAGRGDWVLAQVTSKSYSDPNSVVIGTKDFQSGSLPVISYVRPGKLFTANVSLFKGVSGTLTPEAFQLIITEVVELFRPTKS